MYASLHYTDMFEEFMGTVVVNFVMHFSYTAIFQQRSYIRPRRLIYDRILRIELLRG